MSNIKFARDGQELAEYPSEAIPSLIQSGALKSTDLFYIEGMEDWAMVKTRWKDPSKEAAAWTAKGWTIVSDGPTGIQLMAPKTMKTLDQLAMALGVVAMFWSFILGGFLILIATIDYAFLTKQETKFIPRN